MSRQSDLPLHAEKAVVGRLLGFQVLEPRLPQLESLGCSWAGESIIRRLNEVTERAFFNPASKEPLTLFLKGLATELTGEMLRVQNILADSASRRSTDAIETISGMLEELQELVEDFCTSPSDPIKRLITGVARTAASYYLSCGIDVPAELWASSGSVVGYQQEVALEFAPAIHVQASTRFGKGQPPSGRVFVTLAPLRLDAKTIAALPRVLVHEYVCHVPQGPYHEPRTQPDETDEFAEGWMDYVAHSVHWGAIHLRGPSPELAECLTSTWLNEYEAAADDFFHARCALRDYDQCAAARHEGAAAAREVHRVLEVLHRRLRTPASPDELLYKLSFGLNASALSNSERRRLVPKILRPGRFASESDALVEAVRLWADSAITLEDFAARILGEDGPIRRSHAS